MKWLAFLLLPTLAQAGVHNFQNFVLSQTDVVKESTQATNDGVETSISLNIKEIAVEKISTIKKSLSFSSIESKGLYLTSNIGKPRLPFKAMIVPGKPSDLTVTVDEGQEEIVSDVMPVPAQVEKCRCELDYSDAKNFAMDANSYNSDNNKLYKVEYLGDFRGVSYSRIVVSPTAYDGTSKTLKVYPTLKVSVVSSRNSLLEKIFTKMNKESEKGMRDEALAATYDFLIMTPEKFKDALLPFIEWKQKLGHKFKVATLEEIGGTAEAVNKFTHEEYAKNKYVYAMIVGTEKAFPTNYVKTSGSGKTPSDSTFFIMGDTADIIPDVYHSRLVVEDETQIKNQIAKWMAYEKGEYADVSGFQKGIGIASNEGANPSDNEYVLSIQNKFQVALGAYFSHFYQNNLMSKPQGVLDAFNAGALWTTYMGHGDGKGWPSMNVRMTTADVKKMTNAKQVKPVFIDIACQNGNINLGMAGESLVNSVDADGNPVGVTAYYGGSVNISWHPPAIIARGIAYNYFDKKLSLLGETLFSGHLYLAENYSDKAELAYNYRWFHLFGDPSMHLRDALPSKFTSTLNFVPVSAEGTSYKLMQKSSPLAKTMVTIFSTQENRYENVTSDDKGLINHPELHKFDKIFFYVKNKGLNEFKFNVPVPVAPTPAPTPEPTPEPTPAPITE